MSFTLDGFEIGSRIGSGGFGEVWQARQVGVDRTVAIKVGTTAINDATDQLRFERECKALGRLSTHANIVTVYTSGQLPDGRPILVLEYVDGGTLQKWALSNSSSEAQIMNIGSDLAAALVEAHSHQILHRDLKPQNVLLRTTGEAILADFGIAQLQDGLRTVTGNVTASAAYAAPEVLDGKRASEQSDIYGIGICMLAAATQSTPFTDADDTTLYPVLTRVLTAEPPDITAFGYSAPFNDLVQKLLQKDPANRFNNATEVLTELRRLNAGPDSYERVMPPASTGRADPADDPATEGPEITPKRGLVQHSPPPAPVQPAPVQPAHVVAPQPVTQVPQPAPQSVVQAPPQPAQQPAPATAGVPEYAAMAPAATAAPAAATASTGGMPAAKLGAIIGGLLVAALALFFVFSRGGGDDPIAATPDVNETPAAAETSDQQDSDQQDSGQQDSDQQDSDQLDSQSAAVDPEPASSDTSSSDTSSSDTSSSAPATRMPAGEAIQVSDSIDIALDFREYPIDLVAGQEVSVQVTSMNGSCISDDMFDLRIAFFGPTGEQIGSLGQAHIFGCKGFYGDWEADVDGVHTVRLASGGNPPATGTFEATIATLRRTVETPSIDGSLEVAATIDRAHDSITYEVDLMAGQSLSAAMSSINSTCNSDDYFDLSIIMLDPTGEPRGDRAQGGIFGCDTSGRWVAKVDGTHRLVFFSRDDTGSFEATIGIPESARIALDGSERIHNVTGEISIPRDDVGFEIELSAGQQVSVDLTAMNGTCDSDDYFGLRVRLLDPSGEQIGNLGQAHIFGCRAFGPWAAEEDGVHIVQFYDADGTTGTFDATIGRLGG